MLKTRKKSSPIVIGLFVSMSAVVVLTGGSWNSQGQSQSTDFFEMSTQQSIEVDTPSPSRPLSELSFEELLEVDVASDV